PESASAQSLLGEDPSDLQKDLGVPLPAPAGDLAAAVAADSSLSADVRNWIDSASKLKRVREDLAAPERLAAMLQAHGPGGGTDSGGQEAQTRWLVGLALLVAFVGILNAMLMSVTERFREIGTMKCLGALDGFIVKLFLLESAFQGIVGTLIGIVLGLGMSLIGASVSYGSYAWKNLPAKELLIGIVICLA